MTKVMHFNNFNTSFQKLLDKAKNELLKINIEFYHHDEQSEPFLFIEGKVETLTIEEEEGYGKIISITTSESMFFFTERNYLTNISGDAVVFSSKNDNETYCIIEFI